MAHESPLRQRHQDAGAAMLSFADPERPEHGAAVVDTFGSLEAEYAAIRKGAVLIDQPHRGAIAVRGGERIEFLNRMLTQELKPGGVEMPAWRNVESFWLNRKGRIDADLRLTQLPGGGGMSSGGGGGGGGEGLVGAEMVFDVDILAAARVVETLSSFVFAEDIELEEVSEKTHRFAVHGPAAARLVAENSEPLADHAEAPGVADIADGRSTVVSIAGRAVLVDRRDQAGEIGLHLLCEVGDAEAVFDVLAQHARDEFGHHNDPATDAYKLRHGGWAAFNVARIEAGTPLFRVDFSTTNLPSETGLLEERVSFTKGCYLGQEVVARMKSLGHPKQTLAGLRVEGIEGGDGVASRDEVQARMPESGAAVFPVDPEDGERTPADEAKPIGAVTSVTQSPMLGGATVAFAQLKWGHERAGNELWVRTPAGYGKARVAEGLVFWGRE